MGALRSQRAGQNPAALVALFLALGARLVHAQTPGPSPSPPPSAERPLEVATEEPASSWLFSLGLHGGYESNVDFVTPEDPGDWAGSARATLRRTARTPRGQVSFNLYGSGVTYRTRGDADRIDATADFAARHRASEKATLRFSGSASYLTTDVSRTLIESGLQLPRTQTMGFGGGFGLDIRASERATVELETRYDRIDFDSEELLDTESAHALLRLARQFSARSSLSLSYGFLHTGGLRAGFDDHRAALGWRRLLTHQLSLSLASGAGYARQPPSPGSQEERWYYHGAAGLEGRIRRSTISLQLRRSVNPAYGLGGNLLSYGGALSASISLGRRASLSLGGVHTWSEDPGSQAEQFLSDDASASLSVRFLRRLGFTLAYNYRRLDPADGATIQSHRGSFGFEYTYTRPPERSY